MKKKKKQVECFSTLNLNWPHDFGLLGATCEGLSLGLKSPPMFPLLLLEPHPATK